MASRIQAATLVASPSYPNSVAWSDENLVAIATGHLITILNPNSLTGPRGLITLPQNKPFPIGVVTREDLLTSCLMPISLSRDVRPCVRSLSWSPQGFAVNSGCLLAVCTTEGRVKLYRSPFCDFSAEWIEIMDISDMLYGYLESTIFLETNVLSAMPCQGEALGDCRRKSKRSVVRNDVNNYGKSQAHEIGGNFARGASHEANKQGTTMEVVSMDSENPLIDNLCQSSCSGSKGNPLAQLREGNTLPLITAQQYASRNKLLSSLIVAWSPIVQLPEISPSNCFSNNCGILAVGGKSGNISFWRFNEPQCYTIEHGSVSVDANFMGLLQAHSSWITAISWGICGASCQESQLVLATGSCDGSMKVWLAGVEGLIKSSKMGIISFSLFKEVIAVNNVPISTISLVVPSQSLDKVVLAVGKGSGSLEVWICHTSDNKVESAGVYDVHSQVVTGLAWSFGGCCLYSCSQDNTLHGWSLQGSHLYEVPFSSNFPGLENSNSLSHVSDQCFGIASSPGELMITVVRSFDANLLNQMYQARTQKAVIEFFLTGGQAVTIPSNIQLNSSISVVHGLPERDLAFWQCNILCTLKRYENVKKVLVLWDVIAALLALKKIAPDFVENILVKWISSWFSGFESDPGTEKVLSHAQNMLSEISSRNLHILNILCRRLMLGDTKVTASNREQHGLDVINNGGESIWDKLLIGSESELRERLVAFTFRAVLNSASCTHTAPEISRSWLPTGVAQMKKWVLINSKLVQNQLKLLESKIEEHQSRIHSICEYVMEERCSFCSALVPFESAEAAWCEGSATQDSQSERHRLARCTVSMQLVSITTPMWFCICCQRWAARLVPQTFFTMSKSPLGAEYDGETLPPQECLKPLCPFCGILLQRLLPDFLLSASPV